MKKLIFILLFFIAFSCQEEMMNNSKNDKNLKKSDKQTIKNISKLKKNPENSFDYDTNWKKVKENENYPKTALKITNKIYMMAKAEKNYPQYIKALIFKMKYLQEVEEDTVVKINKMLLNELKEAKAPVKQILHSILAQLYWDYYKQNRYKFLKRTNIKNFNEKDIKTWSIEKITTETQKQYELSLTDTQILKKTFIEDYSAILISYPDTRKLHPTVYDFLIYRAVKFYTDNESSLTKPAYYFTLNKDDYFSMSQVFTKLKIETKDKMSFKYKAIKLYSDWEKFHLDDKDKSSLLDIELSRLEYVYKNGIVADKKIKYENLLRNIIKKYKKESIVSEAYAKLASLYLELSNKYIPKVSEKYKNYKKKAYSICSEAIKNYEGSFGAMNCRRIINRIKTKELKAILNKTSNINQNFKALVKYKNINKLYVRIIKTDFKEYRAQRDKYHGIIEYYSRKEPLKELEFNLPDDKDYNEYSTEIPFPKLKNGKYIILFSNNKNFGKDYLVSYNIIDITNIRWILRRGKGDMDLYLKDSDSGKPLRKARVILYEENWNSRKYKYEITKKKKLKVDKKGHIKLIKDLFKNRNFYAKLYTDNDEYFPLESFYTDYYYKGRESYKTTFYFTDRKIYRPGQTLYFKLLYVEKYTVKGEKTKILPGKNKKVTLYDPNGQIVSSLNLKTDEFGSAHGSFILPKNRLNGNYYLYDGTTAFYFSVEEYKKPKFKVEFKDLTKEYKPNDTIELRGVAKAYAGFNIDGAKVRYRVVRKTYYPFYWRWFYYNPPQNEVEIKNGFTTTDSNGIFKINFKAVPDLSTEKNNNPAFRYTVYVDITDLNGETRSASQSISIGYQSLKLSLSANDFFDKSKGKAEININSTDLNGNFLKAKGKIEVYKLKSPQKVYIKRLWDTPIKYYMSEKEFRKKFPNEEYKDENNYYSWEKEKLLFTAPFDTSENKTISMKHINKWKEGKYVIIAKTKDKNGREIIEKSYFDLIDTQIPKLPFKAALYFKTLKNTVNVGDKAEFLIGSSFKDVRVLYELEYRGNLISKEFKINNELKKITLPILKKYRGNINVRFIFVKHKRPYMARSTIWVPWEDKNLNITFESFRDKLNPGEKEEWRIKIRGNKKEKVFANMLATLYDASLDAIKPNYWNMSIYPLLSPKYYYAWNFDLSYSSYLRYSYSYNTALIEKSYDDINWYGFYWINYNHRRRLFHKAAVYKKSAGRPLGSTVALEEAANEKSDAPMPVAPKSKSVNNNLQTKNAENSDKEKSENTPPQIRRNFSETVFFYPNLRTDKNGNIIISFKMPDSLTKWKMLGFAHTKDLKYGFITKTLVTQKDLMVIPNAPRFLREGDTIYFTSKITNLTDKNLSGKVSLELFDAITMKPVNDLFKNKESTKNFKLEKKKSTLATWKLKIPDNIDAVVYRITAQSGKFSDAEENAVIILKNRMLVTESMPLPLRAKQNKTFKFKKLLENTSKTLINHKITLEFTANPVWYAIESLPYLMEYPYECNEQTFSRYYANSLASYIVNSSPVIKRVFEDWKSKNSKELISNLEKNQELKSIILKETPWIRDAYSETERKKRLALLFDLNRMSNELDTALNKLKKSQLPSGGWPWFNGGYESRWVTQYIVSGFAHLQKLGVIDIMKNKKIKDMISSAVAYLDTEIESDYKNLIEKKYNLNENHLGYIQIQYLYSRSYFKNYFKPNTKTQKAFDYYLNQSKAYWNTYNKYLQGMIALTLNKNGENKVASGILRSIKEHLIENEEMGLYFKESYGYYWYNAPIETHALLIEAFSEINEDEKVVDGLKTWLIKSKQTQNWKTTKATVNAVYALLLKGNNWLKEAKLPAITVGKYKITYSDKEKSEKEYKNKYVEPEKGTGYFKTSWNGNEITKDMGIVKITNNNDLVAWGALYWQYFEDLDKITFAKTPLIIKKELFVEKNTPKGPILKPISKEKPKIGDRIKVRIVLKVDRDMEYVHMKDMRASNLEPENILSRYKWQDGLGYYESTKDTSTDFFFDYLKKGTYVFEYPLRITHKGNFSNGITTIQSMYAPEFTSHSKGIRIEVK